MWIWYGQHRLYRPTRALHTERLVATCKSSMARQGVSPRQRLKALFHFAMEWEVEGPRRWSHYRLTHSSCPSLSFPSLTNGLFLSIFQTFWPLSLSVLQTLLGNPGDLFYSCSIPSTVWLLMAPQTPLSQENSMVLAHFLGLFILMSVALFTLRVWIATMPTETMRYYHDFWVMIWYYCNYSTWKQSLWGHFRLSF